MAQKTFVDGDVLTASDINTYLAGEGGQWTSYTPQVDQGATNIAKTVTYSRYARYGRLIIFNFRLDMTASGTAANNVTITLPVTAVATSVGGSGHFYDLSTTTSYAGFYVAASDSTVFFGHDGGGGGWWGGAPTTALASGDILRGQITYEAAS